MDSIPLHTDLSGLTDEQVIVQYSRHCALVERSFNCYSEWVLAAARECLAKTPGQNMVAAEAFESRFNAMRNYITSEEAGDSRMESFKLTGNSPLANAYKRCLNGLKAGFDLCDTESFPSVSSIEKAVSAYNRDKKKRDEAAKAKVELDAVVEQKTGYKIGTPEHEAAVEREIAARAAGNVVPLERMDGAANDDTIGDRISELAGVLESELRKMEAAGFTDEQLDAKVKQTIKVWEQALQNIIKKAANR